VCAASYEARVFGVRSAMPALRAERLCPEAVFVPPDFARYKAVSRQVREIFLRHTDLVEPLSLDEAYLDVTEHKGGMTVATEIAQIIRAQIREETQLTASAGIAPNKFLAKIASDWRKPDGQFVVPPHRIEQFLTPLPVNRVPGVGKVMAAKLAELGIATVGDLRQDLVRGDPGRGGQLRLFADLRADDLRDLRRHRHPALVLGHIQIRLIQRERFHQLRMPQENLAHLARHRLVTDEIRGHEHRIRTQPLRTHRRHRRTHPEHPCLVTRRADDRAHSPPRHHHRLAPQRRVVTLLHGRVKRVHVDVNDLAGAGHGRRHSDSDEQDYSHTPQYGCWITTTCVFEPENTTAAYG